MRYQKAAGLDVGTYLGAIFDAKNLATRALLAAAKPQVLARCHAYDLALPQLKVPGLVAWAANTEAALLSCYNVKTIPLSKLKDDILIALNDQGQVNLLLCPYCMLNEPSTWDHYLPKDKFPEFSVYHPNLLFVCFRCNVRKLNYHDANGLLYCHPYFSVSETVALLHCSVIVSGVHLTVEYYGASIGALKFEGEIAQRHLIHLALGTRFKGAAASLVSNLIGELRHHFPKGIQHERLKEILRRRYAEARAQLGPNAWDSRLWHGLAANDEFLEYANTQISAAGVPSSIGFDVPAPPHP